MRPAVIVVAKAPVPGFAKTRVAADVGDDMAAELAAASLLDTLDAAEAWAPIGRRLIVLAGDITLAARRGEIAERLADWEVAPQPELPFAARLAAAFAEGARLWGPCQSLLIGMDTPQVTPRDLGLLFDGCRLGGGPTACLGPADDGGWWGLALSDPSYAEELLAVPMSTAQTCARTASALAEAGVDARSGGLLRDMDTLADAVHIARSAPRLRMAAVVGPALAVVGR